MHDNPWRLLPDRPPYVVPEDKPHVDAFNGQVGSDSKRFLQINNVLPEPFVGSRNAPVVLLSNNPGIGKRAAHRQQPAFMDRMRENLLHKPSDYPFVYLDPKFSEASEWWGHKLKHLINRFGREVVARSILNVTYFPYASRIFNHRRLELPSQKYVFGLVGDAVSRRAVIVFMRREHIWFDKVPKLIEYDRRFQVINTQNPAISPRNCPKHEYERVVEAIEATEKAR